MNKLFSITIIAILMNTYAISVDLSEAKPINQDLLNEVLKHAAFVKCTGFEKERDKIAPSFLTMLTENEDKQRQDFKRKLATKECQDLAPLMQARIKYMNRYKQPFVSQFGQQNHASNNAFQKLLEEPNANTATPQYQSQTPLTAEQIATLLKFRAFEVCSENLYSAQFYKHITDTENLSSEECQSIMPEIQLYRVLLTLQNPLETEKDSKTARLLKRVVITTNEEGRTVAHIQPISLIALETAQQVIFYSDCQKLLKFFTEKKELNNVEQAILNFLKSNNLQQGKEDLPLNTKEVKDVVDYVRDSHFTISNCLELYTTVKNEILEFMNPFKYSWDTTTLFFFLGLILELAEEGFNPFDTLDTLNHAMKNIESKSNKK